MAHHKWKWKALFSELLRGSYEEHISSDSSTKMEGNTGLPSIPCHHHLQRLLLLPQCHSSFSLNSSWSRRRWGSSYLSNTPNCSCSGTASTPTSNLDRCARLRGWANTWSALLQLDGKGEECSGDHVRRSTRMCSIATSGTFSLILTIQSPIRRWTSTVPRKEIYLAQ